MPQIAIIDYGMANLHSISKGIEKVGGTVQITDNRKDILQADGVVLPGVGAFRDAIKRLQDTKLDSTVQETIDNKQMFLGICLGLQLLFTKSYEGGEFKGLGIVEGEVVRFEQTRMLKIPQMGWNNVHFSNESDLFVNGVPQDSFFYFVHSYYCEPKDKSWILGTTDYGCPFTSIIGKNNMYATQFHPEKSSKWGLKILENFVQLCRR